MAMKPIANIGDIVAVASFGLVEFQVESFTHEYDYQPTHVEETIIYDVTNLTTAEFFMAYQDEITVVCKAEMAIDYFAQKGGMKREISEANGWEYVVDDESAGVDKPKTVAEMVDSELDEINKYLELIRVIGDEDEVYAGKIREANERLIKLTEDDRI